MTELSGPHLAQLEESVAAAFERSVALHRDSTAIETGTETLTYDGLNRAANRLAHAVLACCGETERPVALIIDGGASPYICLLAVLKAGKAYVALDPMQPLAQLHSVCADVEPGLILTTSNNEALAAQLAGEACACLNVDALDAGLSNLEPDLAIAPSRPAAIFFTSGTTGQPKSIYYDQRSLLHRILTTVLCIDMQPGDRQALHVLCDRTWSATIMFSTLLAGATFCPVDVKAVGVPWMAEWVARAGITHFPMTCSLFRQWMDVLPSSDEWRYPALRYLSVGAEPLWRHDVERFKQHFPPECVLFHSLAMSECGRISYLKIHRETPLPEGRVTVGYADLDKEILIVGDDSRRVAPGETGEIAVRTRYMMSGYWRKPQLTAAVIRPDPDGSDKRIYYTGDVGRIRTDGQLELLGRRDFQVKVRGYRVQPAEVEQRLLELGSIGEAVVVALDGLNGDKRLVAYLVAQVEPLPSATDLRGALAKAMPDYMIPSEFVFLPTLPHTPGGKVDRRSLPPPPGGRPHLSNAYVAPGTALEAQLVRIWEEALRVAPVGVSDDFLELGGDSLTASRVIAGVSRDFGVMLSPVRLFDCPNVGAMAAAVAAERSSSAAGPEAQHVRRTPKRGTW